MAFQRTFRWKVFAYFISVFVLFSVAILSFQLNREKQHKVKQLENSLETVTDLANNYFRYSGFTKENNFGRADSLKNFLLNENIRLTVIDKNGVVRYDSFVDDYENMENHFERPEVQKALHSNVGAYIRHSNTTGQDFYYYARNYGDYFIRTAMVYSVEVENFLKAERFIIFFILFVFIAIWLIINELTRRLALSITALKDFAIKAGRNESIEKYESEFPNNELGEIGKQIVSIYHNLHKAKDLVAMEKERLANHMNILQEGIAFFYPNKERMMTNSHFIQFVSAISNTSTISADQLFEIPEFANINEFLAENQQLKAGVLAGDLPQLEYTVNKKDSYFKISCIIFGDNSFEILINDITKPEKRRLLKQQLTSNIAHELKTPLSSIKGYIETILSNPDIETKKQQYFMQKAYLQTERLNLLLNDISLLNNIEDAGELFEFNNIFAKKLVREVLENLSSRLVAKRMKIKIKMEEDVVVKGNDSLLASVFQNLIENSINYAGEGVTIELSHYMEDDKYHYFSYSDNGVGIPQEHLKRIFERFYRIDSGRTREQGGTGLGLSIVKNAVILHRGNITARGRTGGGIEFLFSLSKS